MKSTLLYAFLTDNRRLDHRQLLLFTEKNDNSRDQIHYQLLELLLSKQEPPTKKLAWKVLFSDHPYSELRLNNIISQTLRLAYDYVVTDRRDQQAAHNQLELATELSAMNLDKQAERQRSKLDRTLNKDSQQSYEKHLLRYRAAELHDQLSLRQKRDYSPHLQRAANELDTYYLTNKLRLACDMAARSRVVKTGTYTFRLIDTLLLEYAAELADLGSPFPVASLYRRMFLFLRTPDASLDEYHVIRDWLATHHHFFSREENKTLSNYLLNFLIGRVNRGETEVYPEILSLYQGLLQRGLLLENSGSLSQWTYANISTTGIRLRAFDWTEQFLNDHRSDLYPEQQHNAYTYNLAGLYFARRDFDHAQQLLMEVEFTDAFYQLSAKLILLKVYYEQGNYAALYSVAESARLYLIRNRQLAEYQRRSIKNFLKIIISLTSLKERKENKLTINPERVTKLANQLATTKELAQRNWLLESFAEIKSI